MANLQPVQFEIGGRKYSTIPLTGFDVLDLERKVADMWLRMQKTVKAQDIDGDDKVSVSNAMNEALAKEMASMSRDEYRNFLELSLSSTTLMGGENERDVRLSDADAVGNAFAGHLLDLPNVIVEVWAANKLSPFA